MRTWLLLSTAAAACYNASSALSCCLRTAGAGSPRAESRARLRVSPLSDPFTELQKISEVLSGVFQGLGVF